MDENAGRLPNIWLFPAIALTVVFYGMRSVGPTGLALTTAAAGFGMGLVMLGPAFALGQAGGGDVKFLAVMGLFVGPLGVLGVMVLGCVVFFVRVGLHNWTILSAGRGAHLMEHVRARRMPMGSSLAVGFVIQLCYHWVPAVF